MPPKLILFSPVYLQPRHSRGSWGSGNTRGTLRERRHAQTRKKAPPHCWGRSEARVGKPRGAGGQEEKQRRQATHTCGPGCQELPIQSPGAPWVGVGGVAKEGERLQATSTPSAGLRGEAAGGPQSPGGPLRVGLGGSGASPPLEEAPSTTHRHAGEDGVSPRGTGALPGLTLERQEPLSGEGQDGGASGNCRLGGSTGSRDGEARV